MLTPAQRWTFGLCCCISAVAGGATKPNVILILADDLGYGDLGCFGQTKIHTPRLDQMAAQGMRFTDFYAGSTVCAPSRCVLMTGLHTGHCRIRGNRNDPDHIPLQSTDLTVAKVFRQAGYATALYGKWGLGEEGSVGVPNKQGFDRFLGYLNQHHAHSHYPAYLIEDQRRRPLRNVVPGDGPWGRGWAETKLDYTPDLVVNEALQWIDQHRQAPFFLFLSLTVPHANNEKTRDTKHGMEIPDLGKYADRDWTDQNKAQAATITRMDQQVGQVLDHLKQLKLDEQTLVLFSSDNGPHKEGGNDPDFFQASGPLRGIKRDLYEGGIRVPTLAWWPTKVAPGKANPHISGFVDLLATVADLTQQTLDPPTDGLSFLPTLMGKDQPQHPYMYWEFYERGSAQAVRFGEWKAISKPMRSDAIEIYRLSDDVGETKDLAASQPAIVTKAKTYFQEAHRPDPAWPIPKAGAGANTGKKKP